MLNKKSKVKFNILLIANTFFISTIAKKKNTVGNY